MVNHPNRSKGKARLAHALALGKSVDALKLVQRLADLEINPNPARALFQLVHLKDEAKEIVNRRVED